MKIIHLLLFIIPLSIFSQYTKKATYTIVTFENERYKQAPDNIKDIMKKFDTEAELLHPILLFNDTISVYKLEDDIILESSGGATILECKKPLYTLLNKNITLRNNSGSMVIAENQYIISDTLKTNWNITTESKKIENFTCYKATQEIKYTNGHKDKNDSYHIFTKNITAWFTPEIPYSFGPKGYGGLPGLIVELQDENVNFGLEKLENLKENVPIILLTKGTKVSHAAYHEIIYKARESFGK